jgi:hypothetical protein
MLSQRFLVIVVVLGLVVGGAAFFGADKNTLGLFHDDGIYAVVAKALAQGEGYRIISLPGAPPQTKYPFLYSYLLSRLWALNPNFPANIALLKLFNCAVLAGIFVLSAVFYRQFFPQGRIGALIFALLVCVNPIIFTFSDYAVSDLLFVFLALGGLALGSARKPAAAWRGALALAVVSGLACLTRLAAAPLALAGAVQSFVRHRWRGALYFLAGVALIAAPWFVWVSSWPRSSADSLFGYYSAYDPAGGKAGGLGDMASRHWPVIAGNARFLIDTFDLLYVLALFPGLWIFIGALTLAGMIASLRNREIFLWCFFLSSLALVLVWPFHPGRYAAPLAPIVILFLFRGAHSIEQWVLSFDWELTFHELLAKIVWVPVAVLLPLQAVWVSSYFFLKDDQTTRILFGKRLPFSWQGFEESFAWVRRNTRPDSLLATGYDPMYYLYTDRRAIRPALHRPASYFYPYREATADVGSMGEIKAQLDQLKVDYLIADPLDGYAEGKATLALIDELVAAYGDKARSVFTSTDGKHRIYAIER